MNLGLVLGVSSAAAAALAVGAGAFFRWGNTHITESSYEYSSDKIPESFNNMKILQISDFHNTKFPKDGKELLLKCRNASPDVIFITGDLIDKRRTAPEDIEVALAFAKSLTEIAPVYYIMGNHEGVSPSFTILKKRLKRETEVILLQNETAEIKRGEDKITVAGAVDPAFTYYDADFSSFRRELKSLADKSNGFTLLLSHRPDRIENYAEAGFPLVLSGHAHGGQVRLPFIGGLYSPNQGVFPKYTAGVYKEGETAMIVSRGLGNSRGPVRVFNFPELVTVTLKNNDKQGRRQPVG